MKYNKIIALLILISITRIVNADCNESSRLEATGKSTLAIHPFFVSQQPEMVSSFRNERTRMRDDMEDGWGGAFQAVLFGGQTTDNDDLARYFFFDGKKALTVAEVQPVEGQAGFGTQDLLAQDFNIFTIDGDFQSIIRTQPKQSVIGLGLHARQSFWKNPDRGRGFWISVSTSIQHVKNNMDLQEQIIQDGNGPNEAANTVVVANMLEAFQQEDWLFGKIAACSSMKKTGLADIEFKVGYEWLQHEPAHMESYFGLVIPTGNANKGEWVFEPIVGRGKYFGVMFGSSLGLAIWENDTGDKNLRYELSNHTEILFKKKQVRSFDLKHRPWSRYLPVYINEEEAEEASMLENLQHRQNFSTPGINVFTQPVNVTPGLTHDINTAFVFTCRVFQGEIGYNFLAKRAENVKLHCPWPNTIALKHYLGGGQTNPIRTINGSPYYEQRVENISNDFELIPVKLEDYEKSIIVESDLDLNSAATPAILTNTLYGTLGFNLTERNYPLFGNFGASYTFSKNNNAAPRRWLLWAKMGLSY